MISLNFGRPSAIQAQENKPIDSLKAILISVPADSSFRKAKLYLELARKYLNISDYVHVTDCIQNSLSLAEQIKEDTLIAACYRYLGIVQMNQHNFSKAVEYDNHALGIYKSKQDKANEALILKALGDDYLQHHDTATAEKYYEQALPLFIKMNDKHGEASVYLNLATVFSADYSKRIRLSLAAIKIFEVYPDESYLLIITLGNLGIQYAEIARKKIYTIIRNDPNIPATENENRRKAEYYLNEAIGQASRKNDFDNASFFAGALAELQEDKGDFKAAYYNIRKYYETQDSIFSQENKNKIAGLESKREIDVKNKDIVNKEIQLHAQRKQRNYSIAGLCLLAVIGVLLYRQNRTRKKTNQTLLQLNKELDEANRLKATFFGILSHDLRSPVANLINFQQLQKREPGLLSEQQIQAREQKITASAESLLETMEAMLLWSKGQMEHFKPDISSVEVNTLFDYLRNYFADVGHIQFSFSGNKHLLIRTDENYLKSILVNLTANAVKALAQTGNPYISFKAWQEPGTTWLSITDNGPGISDEQLKALYDETASSGAKHGLGLHIIRDLAKAIHCTIKLKSPNPEGTVFELGIPGGS